MSYRREGEGDWADRAVEEIFRDLNRRSGMRIDNIDDDIQEEIFDTWAEIIRRQMSEQ